MSKSLNKLIIFAFIWVIGVYGIFWLPDDLLFVYGIFCIIFIILGLVFIIGGSLWYVIKNGDILGIVPIGILASIILLFRFFSPADIKIDINYKSKVDARKKIVSLIKNGELGRDSNNCVWLPDEYQNVTEGSYLYVPILEDDKLLVGFLFKAGFPDEDLWLIYSSDGEDLIKENIDDSLYVDIIMKEENWYFVQFN